MDPIKDGINWYVYCNNNPLKFVDKTGLFGAHTTIEDCGGLTGTGGYYSAYQQRSTRGFSFGEGTGKDGQTTKGAFQNLVKNSRKGRKLINEITNNAREILDRSPDGTISINWNESARSITDSSTRTQIKLNPNLDFHASSIILAHELGHVAYDLSSNPTIGDIATMDTRIEKLEMDVYLDFQDSIGYNNAEFQASVDYLNEKGLSEWWSTTWNLYYNHYLQKIN